MIVIDLEMSGLDPIKNSILSIGAVDFTNPTRRFYMECRIRDGASYTRAALAVNGFTRRQIRDRSKPSPREIVSEFCSWASQVEDRTLAGHNVHIDISFLYHAIRFYNLRFSFGYRNIDSHALTYAHIISRGLKPPILNNRTDITSDYVFNYVGIGPEPKPHKAINGAERTAEALNRLIYGKPLLKEYKRYSVPPYLKRRR